MNRCLSPGFCVLVALAFFTTLPAHAASYYLDSVSGSDLNTGLSPQQAWKTLAPVNTHVFKPGDQILLRSGTEYAGQLAPQGSGDLADGKPDPIVIDSYEAGAPPRIDGQGKVPAALYLHNVEYWEVRHLEITNQGPTPQPHRDGVLLRLDDFGTAHDLHLSDLTIHDVNGSDSKKAGGGAGIQWDAAGLKKKSRYDGLLIENCVLTRCDRNGIAGGGYTLRSQWYPSLHVDIRNNRLNDIGGDGIVPVACDGCVVEHNTLNGGGLRVPGTDGAVGIWPFSCDNTTVQYNEVSGMRGAWDAQAFDADWNCQNTLIQYNYSHDNEGGFLLVCNDGSQKPTANIGNVGTIVRYNLSVNDGFRGAGASPTLSITGPCQNTTLYNNTIYAGKKPAGDTDNALIKMGDWNGWASNTRFYNNIFDAADPLKYVLGQAQQTIFDRNVYYGGQQTIPRDSEAIRKDPLFENPGRSDKIDNYRLQPGSPAIDAGLNIPDAGSVDLANYRLPDREAPTIGAFQAPGAAVTTQPAVVQRAAPRAARRSVSYPRRSVTYPRRVSTPRRRVIYPFYTLPRVHVYHPPTRRKKAPPKRVRVIR